jgi:hypothetical protein
LPKTDYVPRTDDALLIWHDQFKTTVTANITTFGLLAGDATQVNTDNVDIHAKITAATSTAAIAKQATADKNTSRATLEKHARALANRIKAHPAYTAAYGELLGIVGPEDTTNLATSKPTLAGTPLIGGVVQLAFDKSVSEGVNIYARRGTEADFTFLARDTVSPYVDNRPLLAPGKPELREYKAVYVVSDAEIGLFSDEVVVNCAP